MQKFVETRGEQDIGKVNDWYAKCRRDQVPYIVIDKRNKYAIVRWDYISYPPSLDHEQDGQDKYIDEIKSIFRKHANDKSTYEISGGLIHFDFIEVENSHSCANELYDVAQKIYSE